MKIKCSSCGFETKVNVFECPICKQEISGVTEKQAIANLRIHFQTKHPDKKFEKEVW